MGPAAGTPISASSPIASRVASRSPSGRPAPRSKGFMRSGSKALEGAATREDNRRAGGRAMAQKRDSTMSEQRRKADWLRSEMQKPAVMKNPRRLALLKAAVAESQRLRSA